MIVNTQYISEWKSKGISDERIKPATTSGNSLSRLIDYLSNKVRLKFNHLIYITYELGTSSSFNHDPTLENSFFGEVKLTKNADIGKYQYSGYGIGFDRKSRFSFPGGGFGQNIIVFGADMSFFVHVDNKWKDVLILGKGPTQGLEHTITEKKCIQLILLWQERNFA